MKKGNLLLITTCLVLMAGILQAQVLLDVEGDAKIVGKIDLIKAVGDSSLFIGANAGIMDDGGNHNVFVGANAGAANTSGRFNAFVGKDAGVTNTTGEDNSFFGKSAGFTNTTGSANSFVGSDAGYNNTTGQDNSFFGRNAGFNNTTGTANSFFGRNAGLKTTTGDDNSFFGKDAGFDNTTGQSNSFFGLSAGFKNTTGQDNSFVGRNSGFFNTTGQNNSFVGMNSGFFNTTGHSNVFVGRGAGYINKRGTRNTILGFSADVIPDSLDRAIAIGYKAKVDCHNCAVIGGTGEDAVKVGIGTANPTQSLTVAGNIDFNDGSGAFFQGSLFNVDLITGADDIRFSTSNSIEENHMLINANGDIGIGTNHPEQKLHVIGNIRISDVPVAENLFDNAILRINRDGDLVREDFPMARLTNNDLTNPLLEKQQELLEELTILKEQLVKQNDKIAALEEQVTMSEILQEKVAALTTLVEKSLTQNAKIQKGTSYVLPLKQKALLAQNHPNPFRENTLVDYFVPADVQQAHLQVTDSNGKVVGQIAIAEKGQGQVTIQSKSYPSGTYFYSLIVDGQVIETKRMVLAR